MVPVPAALLQDLQALKKNSPVILNLTNLVAMDLTANALLAIGASPIMAHAKEELAELVNLSRGVVLNLGTLDPEFVSSCELAIQEARKLGKPVVLDPVGAGATRYRTKVARDLIAGSGVTVLRGNASEIAAVICGLETTKGVDSTISPEDLLEEARIHSMKYPHVVSISGETDLIFHNGEVMKVRGGEQVMTKVTAMGCTASALTAAFLAVNSSSSHAAFHAMFTMGLASEIAKSKAMSPGSFRVAFVDALYSLEGYCRETL